MSKLPDVCVQLDREFEVPEGTAWEVVSDRLKRVPGFSRDLVEDQREWVWHACDKGGVSLHPVPYRERRLCMTIRKTELPNALDKAAAEAAGVDWRKASPDKLRRFMAKRVVLTVGF